MIRFRNLTKNYGAEKGIFDLSFEVAGGEAFGCLGPKGAGKTTIFSQMLGFSAPNRGWCTIHGKNCYDHQKGIQHLTGFLPERPEFPEALTGMEFIRFQASVRGVRSMERAIKIAERLELNLDKRTGDMNSWEKKCLGIVAAFFHDPEVLLLDEPEKGLDTMKKKCFVDLVLEEKAKKKTVFWASEVFEDMDKVCDRVGMLKNGSMMSIEDMVTLRMNRRKTYQIIFETEQEAYRFVRENVEIHSIQGSRVTVAIRGDLAPLFGLLTDYRVAGFEGAEESLADSFPHIYGGASHA